MPTPREAAPSKSNASDASTITTNRRNADSARHDEPARARAAAAPARTAADNSPSREAPSRGKASAANSGAVEEGTDLTFGRRVPFVRIDSENPYQ
jgi:hypothetical protein